MKKNILILTHDWGGGTERFLNDYISSLVLYNVHILRPEIINNELVYIFTDMQTGKKSGYIYNHLLSDYICIHSFYLFAYLKKYTPIHYL